MELENLDVNQNSEIVSFATYDMLDPVCTMVKFRGPRLRTHNQNMTVAARAIAERKTVGDLS
jgi:hypothetical protein